MGVSSTFIFNNKISDIYKQRVNHYQHYTFISLLMIVLSLIQSLIFSFFQENL